MSFVYTISSSISRMHITHQSSSLELVQFHLLLALYLPHLIYVHLYLYVLLVLSLSLYIYVLMK
jgi:hypothetical protein